MAIITLTTDLGFRDYYVGSLKGAILSQSPEVSIVDISHEIEPFDILQASIVIRNSFKDFPAGTVHIVGVNPDTVPQFQDAALKGRMAMESGSLDLTLDPLIGPIQAAAREQVPREVKAGFGRMAKSIQRILTGHTSLSDRGQGF